LEQHFSGQGCDNVLVYEGRSAAELVRENLWSRVEFVPYAPGVDGTARRDIEATVAMIASIANGAASARIVISDIAWPLNNRLFFGFEFERSVRFSILSDGVATYTCPELSVAQRARNLVKQCSGYLGLSSRYRAYRYSMLGIEHPRVQSIFSFRADLLGGLYKCELNDITLPGLAGPRSSNVALFLDQPYRGFMSGPAWTAARAATVAYLAEAGFDRLYYKTHPMCDAACLEDFNSLQPTVIDSKLPAELVMSSLDADTVISYTSGALFNIKSLAGSTVNAIAFRPQTFLSLDGSGGRSRRSLIDVFRGVGVEIVV
jgi:alpha-2,8-polysialyltransferase (POLYST)